MDCKNCKGYRLCDMVNETPENCPIFKEKEEPKKIFRLEKGVIIRKTPMVLNSDGSWELSESYVEIHYDRIAKEWFEDENGVEVEMEENE